MSIGLIIGIAVLALIVAIAVSQRSRARITQVDTRREIVRKDGDDA